MKHLFTLPVECRPAAQTTVAADVVLGGMVVIRPDGTVWCKDVTAVKTTRSRKW